MEDANEEKVKFYEIIIEYDVGDHWQSQAEIYSCLRNAGAENIKWISGRTVPKHWSGYNQDNPSPGKDIRTHTWKIKCDEKLFTFLSLKWKLKFKEINE